MKPTTRIASDQITTRPPQADVGGWVSDDTARARQEQLLDEGLMETFPASDPVAVVRLT